MGSFYFDGSAVWDIDIFSAINRCKDKGFENSDIVVDVIMTSSANLKEVNATDYKSIQMLFRYLEISSFYNSMDGILRAKFAYGGVNWRYAITSTQVIPSSLKPLVSQKLILYFFANQVLRYRTWTRKTWKSHSLQATNIIKMLL